MAIPQSYVIDSATKQVLRGGFSDFATDGQYNAGGETILIQGTDYPQVTQIDLLNQTWYWHAVTSDFQQTPPP